MIKVIIKTENLLIFFTGLVLFHNFSNNWVLFIILFLIPDISMVGYFINKRAGAIIYNCIHNYILCLVLLFLGLVLRQLPLLIVASILLCHVGIDRFLGFGLKYDDFKKTHIQKI